MIDEEQSQRQQMCSNISSGGGGGGRSSKKQKHVKVPQRGPGVAELEKILREQQNKEDDNNATVELFPHSHHSKSISIYNPPPPPPPPPPAPRQPMAVPPPMEAMDLPPPKSLTRHIPLVLPDLDLLNPNSLAVPTLYSDAGGNSVGGGGGGGGGGSGSDSGGGVSGVGGSDLITDCPGRGRFPTMWRSSYDSSFKGEVPKFDSGFKFAGEFEESYQIWQSRLVQQRKYPQYPSPMVNVWPSTRLDFNMTEPPSNQKNYDNICTPPGEEKGCGNLAPKIGMKRPWPFSVDNTWVPPPHPKAPSFSPDMQGPQKSSSSGYDSTCDSEPGKSFSRYTNRGNQPEHKSQKCIADYGACSGNFFTWKLPTTPPSTQTSKPESWKFDFVPLQGCIREKHQKSGPSSSTSVQQKPLYSFLLPKEQTGSGETSLSLNHGRGESGGEEDIDLNLKL